MKHYTPEHEWIEEAGKGSWRVGISNYAQEQLGDVITVELPEQGQRVAAGESCAVIESVKSASDIYAPVAGKIVALNAKLAANPELVNADAEGKGWLFRIEPDGEPDLAKLLDLASYQESLA